MNTKTYLLAACALLLASCATKPKTNEPALPERVEASTQIVFAAPKTVISRAPASEPDLAPLEEMIVSAAPLAPKASIKTPQPAKEPEAALEKYKVTLSVESTIKIPGPGGELRVWIGDPNVEPLPGVNMTASDVLLPALGKTAKVTPFAPAFTIEPKASMCIKVDPSGSVVRFNLVPKKEGRYKVTAEVQLYESNNCEGAAVPKSAATLDVIVAVDKEVVKQDRIAKFISTAWDKLLEFWGAALAAIGAGILVLFRKQLAKWLKIADK